MTDGQVTCPLVIRTGNGGSASASAPSIHRASRTGRWRFPVIKVVAPSNPHDVVGLMAAAVRDPDPVLFFEHKGLYATKQDVVDGEIVEELGAARTLRTGSDCTIVALALMVPRALEAAEPTRGRGNRLHRDRPSEPRSTRCDHECSSRSVDQSAVHRRGEPAGMWLGRRSRLDRCERRRSGISTVRSFVSPHRTCRSRPPTCSRIWRSHPSNESSTRSARDSTDERPPPDVPSNASPAVIRHAPPAGVAA